MKCVKYLLFIFNFIFWVSARFVDIQRGDVTRKLMEQVQQRARHFSSHLSFTRKPASFTASKNRFVFLLIVFFSMPLSPLSLFECTERLTVRDGRRFVVCSLGSNQIFHRGKERLLFRRGSMFLKGRLNEKTEAERDDMENTFSALFKHEKEGITC